MQYRDVFDNHAPLFHIVFAPVYWLFGERADILSVMRLAVIPLFFLSLWAVYHIGKALYSREVGIWAAILTGLYPAFFMTSVEFRADDLWMTLWLLTLAVLVQKSLTRSKLVLTGLLLGATFSASMKTTLLLSALFLAFLVSVIFTKRAERLSFRQYAMNGLLILAGLLIIPSILLSYFDVEAALRPLYYGLIQHNIVPGLSDWKQLDTGITKKIIAFAIIVIAGIYLLQSSYLQTSESGLQQRRRIIFLTYGLSTLGLYGFWPLITSQDFLPLIPLLIIIITGSMLELMRRKQNTTGWILHPKSILLLFAILELGTFLTRNSLWHPQFFSENKLLAEVLQLTRPEDAIMDLKGESVFRERPFFYALEGVTRQRIQLGLIKDSIAEDIAHSNTTVAALDSPFFPSQGREFLNNNFLPVGRLRVAGKMLVAEESKSTSSVKFDVHIPTEYVLLAEHGAIHGWLDDTLYDGPRQLGAGQHTFRSDDNKPTRLALIWAQAVERGFSPFNLSPKYD